MKAFSFVLAAILILISTQSFSQNDDEWESETYEIGDFKSVYLEGGFKVYLIQGKECSLTVRASDAEVFDYLKVKNNRSSLELKVDRKPFDFNRVNLYITFRTLEQLRIEGGVRMKTKGYLDLNDLYVQVEGGAKIELDIKAENVKIVSEGGVLFELQGVAESLDVKVSGAGHINAGELKTKNVSFQVEGVGTGNVYATETLNTKIEGVGKIKYRGNPDVTRSIDGVGSVVHD